MNAMTFPFSATRGAAVEAAPDNASLLATRVGAALARLVPTLALTTVVSAVPPPGDRVAVAMLRSDGLRCAVDIAPQIAEALASLSLGGSFSAEAARAETATPSVRRAQRTLIGACLEAVDAVWPGDGTNWQAASGPVAGTTHGFTISAGELSAAIGLVIAAPDAARDAGEAVQTATGPRTDVAWARGMRALLGATGLPLRAVLHERQLPLTEAVQLAPGDVLPIEAPRDVQLRIGTHHIARGTIAPLGDEGALLVTIISRRPDPATLASIWEPS
jgi:hypothetical protein